MSAPPALQFESLFNVRDLGGLEGHGGRTIRPAVLYRADGIYRIVDADLDRWAELGITTVFDLRTARECTERGRFPIDRHPADYHHLPMMLRTWDEEGLQADGSPEFFAARYVAMLESGAPSIARAFEVLAGAESLPAVIHCSAGKDRTGVLTAVVLAALGVDDDDIADDYAASGPGVVAMFEWLRENRPEYVMGITDQLTPETEAPRTAMVLLLDEVRSRHGSVAGYLSDIGVHDETIAAVRDTLLS